MTKNEQVTRENLLERVVKSVDMIETLFLIKIQVLRLEVLASSGFSDQAEVDEFKKAYLKIRDSLVPDLHPGHILYDENHDRPAEVYVEVGDLVRWHTDGREHSGRLIFVGRHFSRHEICPIAIDGWVTPKARALFIKSVVQERKKIKTPIRQLCLSGVVVRVDTKNTKTKKRGYIYYCPLIQDLRKVKP